MVFQDRVARLQEQLSAHNDGQLLVLKDVARLQQLLYAHNITVLKDLASVTVPKDLAMRW